jgi:hypothetical protein
MTQLSDFVTRVSIQLVLLPVVAVIVPLMFAVAWLREACSDLTQRA